MINDPKNFYKFPKYRVVSGKLGVLGVSGCQPNTTSDTSTPILQYLIPPILVRTRYNKRVRIGRIGFLTPLRYANTTQYDPIPDTTRYDPIRLIS